MARRKRRDEDAVDKRLDQDTDEARDKAAEDSSDDALDTTDADSDDELEAEPVGRGGVAVKRAKADSDTEAKVQTQDSDKPKRTGRGPFARLSRFLREVFAEMRKVIWPTRKELLTYTVVVVFFVAVMLSIIGLFDVAFARAMLWVFGSNTVEE